MSETTQMVLSDFCGQRDMHQCCLICEIFQYCPVRLQRTAKYSPLLSKLCYRWSHCPVRPQWPVRYTSVLSGHKTQRSVSEWSYYQTQHCTISASFQILWKFSCLPFLRNHFSIIICGFCWWLNGFFFFSTGYWIPWTSALLLWTLGHFKQNLFILTFTCDVHQWPVPCPFWIKYLSVYS